MSLPPGWKARLDAHRLSIDERGLRRVLRAADRCAPGRIWLDGRELLNFSTNDYLGLSTHPRVVDACVTAARSNGVGSGAAHLLSGHSSSHQALEEELAAFLGRSRVLLFSTGYMANLGVLSALADRRTVVYQDRLNHASLIDGARLAGAALRRFAHGSLPDLKATQGMLSLVVSDGLFSMDGDLFSGLALTQRAKDGGALLMVDDAHGIGALGPKGQGTLEVLGLSQSDVPILMGTLGKAFGVFGAFVAGDDSLIDHLVQAARPFVYSTALPPALAEASRAALSIIREEPWRRLQLNDRIRLFREEASRRGLPLLPSETAIQPILVGNSRRTIRLVDRLNAEGFLVGGIRPPTVPVGTARLRCTLTASHNESDLERLLDGLEKVFRQEAEELRSCL